jgi:hypothetical protein
MLDFAFAANYLRSMGTEGEKINRLEVNSRQVELLQQLLQCFFGPKASQPIALINQVLREEVCEALTSIREEDSREKFDKMSNLVCQARSDYRVWKGGLDKAYNQFLASKPSLPTMTAVLLTIM